MAKMEFPLAVINDIATKDPEVLNTLRKFVSTICSTPLKKYGPQHVAIIEPEDIRRRVFDQLKGKRFDVALLVETGGARVFGSHEITTYADRIYTLPLSQHSGTIKGGLEMQVGMDKLLRETISGRPRSVLVLENDVGCLGRSYDRLTFIKDGLKQVFEGVDVTMAAGLIHERGMASYAGTIQDKNLDIRGNVVNTMYMTTVEDIVNGFKHGTPESNAMMAGMSTTEFKRCVGIIRSAYDRRPTLPVLRKPQRRMV